MSRYTTPSNGVTHFSGIMLVMSINTHRAKPDLAANERLRIYRNMFLNLGAYNIQACTGAREYTLCFLVRHVEADVFRRDTSKWRLRESGTVILLEL
jgi:hypothetical protein